jgi:adenylate cyclase
MGVEIERKFLVNAGKWNALNKPEGIAYRQGYIVKEEAKTVRIRIAGKDGFITIKGKSSGISRSEFEYSIPEPDAEALLAEFCQEIIAKTRYNITYAGKLWEVDVFAEDNDGLIVAEIELDNEAESFDLPDWLAKEVTGDIRYYNSSLAENPFKNW